MNDVIEELPIQEKIQAPVKVKRPITEYTNEGEEISSLYELCLLTNCFVSSDNILQDFGDYSQEKSIPK